MDKIRKSKTGGRFKFDASVRRKAVLEYHNGTGTIRGTARAYGVDPATFRYWIKWYEQDQAQLISLGAMDANKNGSSIDQEPTSEDLKALQEELRLAKVKLACLETLIDITEQDLGIDIRKKPGTRSSAE
jgi:transposase-like protein